MLPWCNAGRLSRPSVSTLSVLFLESIRYRTEALQNLRIMRRIDNHLGLARDLRHLVNTVGDLTKCSIGLRVLAGEGASIDTTTANGRLIFAIFAGLAEFERELIVERTQAGLASA